jgi:hypothetical protein
MIEWLSAPPDYVKAFLRSELASARPSFLVQALQELVL